MTQIDFTVPTDLPNGHVPAIVTYLEMRTRPVPSGTPARPGLALARVPAPAPETFRTLYRRIGTDYLWSDRLRLDDAALSAILGDPAVEFYVPEQDGAPVGMLELDFRNLPDVEIAFFGLVPEAVGAGTGRWLMDRALEIAWREGVNRVWLHTCTLDHPSAIRFYRSSGFVPYRRTLEVVTDPRLDGLLPMDAAPQIPVIE